MLTKYFLLVVFILSQYILSSQTIEPDLQDTAQWKVYNRSVSLVNDNGKKVVSFNELPGVGLMVLKNSDFSYGSIELDIKGNDKMQQSFVGFAFHGQSPDSYDAIYFRPFNFKSGDAVRRSHSVQYISMPGNDWEKLRTQFPGKYEHGIEKAPGPNDWFHVKIEVMGKRVTVFVNNESTPSLTVDKLNQNIKGGFALWVGNSSGGAFANLKIEQWPMDAPDPQPTAIPYGNNPAAGHYFDVGGAKLYYEIYGQGKPLVMLHGGVYGYIDEFEPFIKRFAENYQVICIATRGHGKSEIGKEPFTYQQRADDAYKVIRSITKDSVIVVGFSDGAFSGLKLAATHPELVSKLVSIGVGDYPLSSTRKKYDYAPASLMKYDSAFFAARVALMPEPARWAETLQKLNKLYNGDHISTETFTKIKCPVLVMAGDRDDNTSPEAVVKCARAIPKAQLSIIPGCHHVVFYCNFPAVWDAIHPFLKN
jgi:pimeloyl-ACP methyl ester carboxylesterase